MPPEAINEQAFKTLSESLETVQKEKGAYLALIKESDDKLRMYEDFGSPDDIKELIKAHKSVCEELKKTKDYGSIDQMMKAIDTGTATLTTMKEELDGYRDLGDIAQIQKVFAIAESKVLETWSSTVSASYNVDPKAVKKMLESCDNNKEAVESLLKATGKTPKVDPSKTGTIVNEDKQGLSFVRKYARQM